jgi:anti-anti-sigma factor
MTITIRKTGDAAILDLDGLIPPEELQEKVHSLLGISCNRIAVNLTLIPFAESNSLSALLQCSKMCKETQGAFSIFGVQPYVQNLLDMTRLNQVIDIQPDESAALKQIQS